MRAACVGWWRVVVTVVRRRVHLGAFVCRVVVRHLRSRAQARLTSLLHSDDSDSSDDAAGADVKELNWSHTAFASVRRRQYLKSSRLYFRMLLRFAGPAFAILAYLFAIFLWDRAVLMSTRATTHEVHYATLREVAVHRFDYQGECWHRLMPLSRCT